MEQCADRTPGYCKEEDVFRAAERYDLDLQVNMLS